MVSDHLEAERTDTGLREEVYSAFLRNRSERIANGIANTVRTPVAPIIEIKVEAEPVCAH